MGEWVAAAEPAGVTSGLKGSKSKSSKVSSFFTSRTSFWEGVVTLISGTKLSSKKLMMFSCCSSFVGVTLGRGGTGGPFLVCEGDLGRTGAGDAGANVWLGLAVGLGRGEASSGGDGVFAMRRGPESLGAP